MKNKALHSVVLFLLFSSSVRPQTQAAPPDSPPQYSLGPVTDYKDAQPNSSDVLRFRRGQRYNIPDPSVPELAEQRDPGGVTEWLASYYHDPMPISRSDAVVVGAITSGQAYLSNDKRDFYSEFKAVVQEVLKAPTAHYIRMGDRIAVERKGGSVRLPSGKVVVRGFTDASMPLVGKRYLLFLRYSQDTDDFHILTGYQLEGQRTYSLDELGYHPSDRRHETLIHPLHEYGGGEEQLLNGARAAAKSSNKGGQ